MNQTNKATDQKDQALRAGGMVYEYGNGIMPPRPEGIRFPEKGNNERNVSCTDKD